jgi:hypothetical protein
MPDRARATALTVTRNSTTLAKRRSNAQSALSNLKTGEFPEGTVIVKELTRVLNPTFPDGSRTEPSGRGYFNGEYNGIDLSVKDSKRFAKTNGWGFFTFGHHPLPYEKTAAESVCYRMCRVSSGQCSHGYDMDSVLSIAP